MNVRRNVIFRAGSRGCVPSRPAMFNSCPGARMDSRILGSVRFTVANLGIPVSRRFRTRGSVGAAPLVRALSDIIRTPTNASGD